MNETQSVIQKCRIENLVNIGDLIIFDEKTGIVHSGDDLEVCINGNAVQITIREQT